jgi:prevent-host-death family protein
MSSSVPHGIGLREARNKLGELVERAKAGEDVIVERYGQPVAVVIAYRDYLELLEELQDMRDAREAEEVLDAYYSDPSAFTTLEEYEARLGRKVADADAAVQDSVRSES